MQGPVEIAAGVYCRISDDRLRQGLGVKRQEEDCRAYCASRGWRVEEVYVDNDVSAYSGRRRPGYERLLADLEERRIRAVVAWHPDRLHRSPLELERFIQVVESTKARVGTVKAGEYDLTTPSGRMAARIVGAVARGESEHKSERIRRKHQELAAAGKGRGGGTRPFGFRPDRLSLDPVEADLVREATQRILAGESIRGLCANWTARGIQTVQRGPWKPAVMRRMLLSGRIAGLREHHGVIVAQAVWAAIITETEHRQLRAILADPARRKNRNARRYLLTGFVVCSQCNARMVARPRDDGRRRYVCARGPGFDGCGSVFILAEPVEDLVVAMVLEAVDSPALSGVRSDVSMSAERASTDVTSIESKLAELAEEWAEDRISRSEWHAARRALEERMHAARKSLARLTGGVALDLLVGRPGPLHVEWKALDLDRRRAVLSAVLDKVLIGPARRGYNRFDPDRLEVLWRA